MNTLDILILVILAANAVLGAVRGAAWQILRLASIFLGLWGAARYGEEFLGLFPSSWGISEDYGIYVARVVLFLCVYLIMFGVTNLVKGAIQKVKLGSFDRGFGALIGAAKGLIFCTAILYLQLTPIGEITVVQDHLNGNEEKSIPPSIGNKMFLKYARERLENAVPKDIEDVIERKTKDLIKKSK